MFLSIIGTQVDLADFLALGHIPEPHGQIVTRRIYHGVFEVAQRGDPERPSNLPRRAHRVPGLAIKREVDYSSAQRISRSMTGGSS